MQPFMDYQKATRAFNDAIDVSDGKVADRCL
jgi:hypothetical protein